MTNATFAYVVPSPALSDLVAFHYCLEVGASPFDETLCALLAQVQIGIGGPAALTAGPERRVLPDVALLGATDKAMRMTAPPGYVAVGCGLTPKGWQALTGGDLGRMGNVDIDAAKFFATVQATPPDLAGLPGNDARLSAFDAFLVDRLATAPPPDPRIAVIDAWIIDDARPDAAVLAASLGLSRRSLERLTTRTHGAAPTRLALKYRTLMAAARMAVGEVANWRAAATLGGFSDQAHFIRDFKRFVGMTPHAFMADPDAFPRRLLRGQWEPGRELGITIFS